MTENTLTPKQQKAVSYLVREKVSGKPLIEAALIKGAANHAKVPPGLIKQWQGEPAFHAAFHAGVVAWSANNCKSMVEKSATGIDAIITVVKDEKEHPELRLLFVEAAIAIRDKAATLGALDLDKVAGHLREQIAAAKEEQT